MEFDKYILATHGERMLMGVVKETPKFFYAHQKTGKKIKKSLSRISKEEVILSLDATSISEAIASLQETGISLADRVIKKVENAFKDSALSAGIFSVINFTELIERLRIHSGNGAHYRMWFDEEADALFKKLINIFFYFYNDNYDSIAHSLEDYFEKHLQQALRKVLKNREDIISIPYKSYCWREIEGDILLINTASMKSDNIGYYGDTLLIKKDNERDLIQLIPDHPEILALEVRTSGKSILCIHISKASYRKLVEFFKPKNLITREILDNIIMFNYTTSNRAGCLVIKGYENNGKAISLSKIVPKEVTGMNVRAELDDWSAHADYIEEYSRFSKECFSAFFKDVDVNELFLKVDTLGISETYINKNYLYKIFASTEGELCYRSDESSPAHFLSIDGLYQNSGYGARRVSKEFLEKLMYKSLKKSLPDEADSWLLVNSMANRN